MAITNTDIVLFQSQDNTDNENGGGSRTSVPVADGAVNNLFPDISRIDTVAGDVALRKVFPVVNTDDREIYYGAHAIIRKVPEDPRVSALLFYTDDPTDTRVSAQSDVESYLIPSFQAPFYLFGSNIEGAKAVTFLQRVEENVPDIGEVFVLQEGQNTQYIRFSSVDATSVRIFFNGVDYDRRRVIATIEQALLFTFTGSDFNPAGQQDNTADTFATQVADAARFYGNKGLAEDAEQGSTAIETLGIFEQLVPASTQQTAILNKQSLSRNNVIVEIEGAERLGRGANLYYGTTTLDLGSSLLPGSVQFNNFTDNGEGRIVNNSNSSTYNLVNYETGILTYFNADTNGFWSWIPAFIVETPITNSTGILINSENQGNVYIRNVAPVPSAASLFVDYRSGGKWYRLNGNVDGSIGSDNGIGVGIVLDNGDGTGTISVTLGALPDINSTVIFAWGSSDALTDVNVEARDTYDVWFEWKLPHENIDPNDFELKYDGAGSMSRETLNWSDASTEVEMTSPNVNGVFRLDAVNGIVYLRAIDRDLRFNQPFLTTSTTTDDDYLEVTYSYAAEPGEGDDGERVVLFNKDLVKESDTVYKYDIDATIEIANVAVLLNGKMEGSYSTATFDLSLMSDINGILRQEGTTRAWGTVTTAGLITINVPSIQRQRLFRVSLAGDTYNKYSNAEGSQYKFRQATSIEYSESAISTYDLTHTAKVLHNVACYMLIKIPSFIIGKFQVAQDNRGFTNRIYSLFIGADNVISQNSYGGQEVGVFNRETGIMKIKYGGNGYDSHLGAGYLEHDEFLEFRSLFVDADKGGFDGFRQVFRAGASNIVNSSFILRYATINGNFVATSDQNGVFTGTDMDVSESYVDTLTGAVFLVFTEAANPQSIFFDAVATTTLPLDPELLGLNPVRLPPDGRVPIFYPGAFIVIFQEESTDAGTPNADQVITLDRSGQSYIEVIDVNGQRLAYNQYVADRDAGTVTFASGLNLVDRQGDSLTTPLAIIDRVEDMALCTDTSVTGRISISAPLSRDYIAGQARVASALVWGDIGSRVFNLFSAASFSVWSNEIVGNTINAKFDNVNYPIQINNKDSFTGRWALIFTSSSAVDVISEKLGVLIEDAPINADIEPINPATDLPYFTIPTGGWGGGWVTSNLLRFNTTSGSENMWVIRTVQSGALTEQIDSIEVEIRGDAN
jgi:hypothetical protein